MAIVAFSTVYPVVYSVETSLWQTQVFERVEFLGLGHYVSLLTDPTFYATLYRSAFFTLVGVAVTFVLGFTLALLLRRKTRLNALYRTLILIPWVTNEIVFALMWLWMLDPQLSPIFYWMSELGLPTVNLLGSEQWALLTLTLINGVRAVGFSLVMILAGLTAIPKELEEAAAIDGSNSWHRMRYIILPLLKPVSVVIVIVLTISFINIIGFVLIMTGGGPADATELLSVRLYKQGFVYFNIGLASALTVIMLTINLVLAWIYKKSMGADED
ncbi:carbohydrate ABC transporter permease [Microbacterium aurantiacum]|uniref:Sugar ABC transporter permease n=1 Tax=Microbacterium aurantiacum TaxID=162393 RepID=A0AAJ2M218_9MICO|nr:sugar ABC transporter permease [Microbacterium aurantiacum]MDS0246971.1 sugar ABC transporter permease [Microbacterium aurantiacum]